MATAKKGKVTLSGGFPSQASVALYERIGDTFTASLPQVGAKRRVDKHSEVTFEGLEVGKPYWIAGEVDGEWRARAVVGKEPDQVRGPLKAPRRIGVGQVLHRVPEERLEHAASLRSQAEAPEIVSGQRTTKNTRVRGHAKPASPFVLEHDTDDMGREDGLLPLGHKDEPKQLASDTLTGVAVEAAPDRLQQEDVPKGVKQASATELGDAAIIVELEEDPLGDIDPNRASGDSAVGPAGTVGPVDFAAGEKPPESTSKVTRKAEKSAARKSPGAKRRPSRATRVRRVRRAEQRNAEKRAVTGDLTPGENPVAEAGDDTTTPPPEQAPLKRAERPTRDARTPAKVGDDDAARAAKRAARNARDRERRAAKKSGQGGPANA